MFRMKKTIDEFVQGLCAIDKEAFTIPRVDRYLKETPVDPSSLAPYLFYNPERYTRNLIYKCDLFELLTICWDEGQGSSIHNHQNQNCWMAVPIGRLLVQNYEVVRIDQTTGFCELKIANRLVMDPERPSSVDPEMPVHAVLNLPEYRQRATSIHVYSRPYDHCLVYSLSQKSYQSKALRYDSEYGQLR